MTVLQDIRDACSRLPKGAASWADELVEVLAKAECKRHYDLPAWTKLLPKDRKRLLKGGENTLETIAAFFERKMTEGN